MLTQEISKGTLFKTPGILRSLSHLMVMTYTNPELQYSMLSSTSVYAKCCRNTEKGVAKYTNIVRGAGKSFLEEVLSSCVLQHHEQRRQGLRPLQTEGATKDQKHKRA